MLLNTEEQQFEMYFPFSDVSIKHITIWRYKILILSSESASEKRLLTKLTPGQTMTWLNDVAHNVASKWNANMTLFQGTVCYTPYQVQKLHSTDWPWRFRGQQQKCALHSICSRTRSRRIPPYCRRLQWKCRLVSVANLHRRNCDHVAVLEFSTIF